MCKLIIFLSAVMFSICGYAENIDVEIYDSVLRKNLVLNVNVYTGQYTTSVVDHFQTSLEVDGDNIGICNFVDKVLRDDPTTYALGLMNINSNRKIKWKFFDNFRELERLELPLSKKLEKKGYRIKNLTNLTKALVEEIEVKKIVWNSGSLSLKNDDLLAKAETDIKRMLELAPGRSSEVGHFEDVSKYEFLYCDLLRGQVSIHVSLKGSQRKYFDEKITPLKVTLSREVIASISQQLNLKRNDILSLAKTEALVQRKSQIQLVTSVGYLAQILADKNIKMSDFENDEFFKLLSGVVNMTSGLPVRLNEQQAHQIEKSLYRDAFDFNDTTEFELDALFQ